MKECGIDNSTCFFSNAPPPPPPPPPPLIPNSSQDQKAYKNHSNYKQFFKMLKVGIPKEAVKNKMELLGEDLVLLKIHKICEWV